MPVGANEERPDYEFADGVTFHIFEPQEGPEVRVAVPSLQGEPQMTLTMRRTGQQLALRVEGAQKPWFVCLRGVEAVQSLDGGTAQTGPLGALLTPQTLDSAIQVTLGITR